MKTFGDLDDGSRIEAVAARVAALEERASHHTGYATDIANLAIQVADLQTELNGRRAEVQALREALERAETSARKWQEQALLQNDALQQAQGELRDLDFRLARRDALDGIASRTEKIDHLLAVVQRADPGAAISKQIRDGARGPLP